METIITYELDITANGFPQAVTDYVNEHNGRGITITFRRDLDYMRWYDEARPAAEQERYHASYDGVSQQLRDKTYGDAEGTVREYGRWIINHCL